MQQWQKPLKTLDLSGQPSALNSWLDRKRQKELGDRESAQKGEREGGREREQEIDREHVKNKSSKTQRKTPCLIYGGTSI